ncbi:hypothetical protein [Paraburkholderia bannensis]|uniref:hypothetical protein n=1 Tax=Paraburkholderia bannensis TaxID=765414 RepID=UPI002AB6F93E|nr:hypothetical protein [Paraburkholderia bannensis]
MKLSHKLQARSTASIWLLAFGLLLSITGVTLWCHGINAPAAEQTGRSFGVPAVLIGVISTIYAAHELSQRRR